MELGATQWTRENVLYGTFPDIISGRAEQRKQLRYVCGFADIVRWKHSARPFKYSVDINCEESLLAFQ